MKLLCVADMHLGRVPARLHGELVDRAPVHLERAELQRRGVDPRGEIGGPARQVAHDRQITVVALDLTESFCLDAATLSRAVDLRVGADRTSWTVRSTLTVQALADGVQRFPLVQSRRDVALVPVLGCHLEHGTANGTDELVTHHAVFPRALAAGDIHVYGYDTSYTARSDHRDRYVVGVATPTAESADTRSWPAVRSWCGGAPRRT